MRKIILLLMVFSFSFRLEAQEVKAVVSYDYYFDYLASIKHLPWVTPDEAERDALLYGNRSARRGSPHLLKINGNKSTYAKKPSDANYGYSWVEREFTLYRDLNDNRLVDKITLLDRDYYIQGEIPKLKWKILNEIREIEGYMCMKASTIHPLHGYEVYAWFSDQIQFRGGPEGFGGLPGLILSLEIADVAEIIATKVNFEKEPEVDIPEKGRSRKISYEEYKSKYQKYYERAIKREENPFWELRM